ncbi:MAG: Protein tyrosine and serine/threonine kinase [Chlamydiales bacterium]|jgi:tetratricopeptide (TPR) repeat protein|nr:Protein tyrosine and serine/threonine kinase [Chlamydiales bacterium]
MLPEISYPSLIIPSAIVSLGAALTCGYLWKQKRKGGPMLFMDHIDSDFFGEKVRLRTKSGHLALCKVLDRQIYGKEELSRLANFQALTSGVVSGLAPMIEVNLEGMAFVSYGKIGELGLEENLLSIGKRALSRFEAEMILVSLAKMLQTLHEIKALNGRRLYHGFLIPSNLFIEKDEGVVRGMMAADGGLAFALGAQALASRLALAEREGKIDQRELSYLAPEQKDQELLQEVGVPSDFYAFGAIAVLLFTGHPFVNKESVNWSLVPAEWSLFLDSCLEPSPKERPADFTQLDEGLFDFAWYLKNASRQDLILSGMTESSIEPILEKLQRNRQGPSTSAAAKQLQALQLKELLLFGCLHLEKEQWTEAVQIFELMLKHGPAMAEPHAYLALCFHHLKRDQDALLHYQQAQSLSKKVTTSILKGTFFSS